MRRLPPPHSQTQENDIFGKEEALILSAMAVLIMIWHHLFGFKEFYLEGTEWHSSVGKIGEIFTLLFAKTGNICVPMFAIMSGYALYVNYKSFDSWQRRGKRLFRFLVSYWVIFALFLLAGYVNGADLPNSRHFLENLFGINTGPGKWVNVSFAWYVAFYIEFLLIAPFIYWLFKKEGIIKDILAFIGIYGFVALLSSIPGDSVLNKIFGALIPLSSVVIGILIAKYNLFERLHNKCLKFIPSVVIAIWIVSTISLRYLCNHFPISNTLLALALTLISIILPTFLVILCVEIISRMKNISIRKPLVLIGSLSMYLWFLHGFFQTGNHLFEKELYSIKEPILIYLICLIALIPIAYIVDKGVKYFFSKTRL